MKIISVVSCRKRVGQSDCAYTIAKSLKKDGKVLLIDFFEKFYSNGSYYFKNKSEVKKFVLSLDLNSQKKSKLSETNLDYVLWSKLNNKTNKVKISNKYDFVVINCPIISNVKEFHNVLNSSHEIIIPVTLDSIWISSLHLEYFIRKYKKALPIKSIAPVYNLNELFDPTDEYIELQINKIKNNIINYAQEFDYKVLDEIFVFDDWDFYNKIYN